MRLFNGFYHRIRRVYMAGASHIPAQIARRPDLYRGSIGRELPDSLTRLSVELCDLEKAPAPLISVAVENHYAKAQADLRALLTKHSEIHVTCEAQTNVKFANYEYFGIAPKLESR